MEVVGEIDCDGEPILRANIKGQFVFDGPEKNDGSDSQFVTEDLCAIDTLTYREKVPHQLRLK